MKKKGFTLIELLAVIVIIAVIVSITTGIILNIIEKSRYESAKLSVLNYVDAIEFKVAQNKLYDGNTYRGLYSVKEKELTDNVITMNVDIKGTLPKEGSSVTINNDGKVNDGVFYIDKYKIAYNGETKEVNSEETNNDDTPKSIEDQLKELTAEVASLKKNSLNIDNIYPVGSIYISAEDDTIEKVQNRFGGTWERYAEGTALVSTGTYTDSNGNINSYAKNSQGGSNNVTLTTNNLPAHTHSVIAKGTVSSTFTGTAVNTGVQSANHTHTFSGTTSTEVNYQGYGVASLHNGGNNQGIGRTSGDSPNAFASSDGHFHQHTFSGTTSGISVNHTHSVTAKGTVSSTFTGTSATTSSTGSGTSFSVQNPYTSVYMYKRIK